MRLRVCVLACALGMLGSLVAAGASSAAPQTNRLTIAAAPNPITAGEGALIFGRLSGPNNADQTIYLYHRVVGAAQYTLIARTTTDAFGFYAITRPDGLIYTNRNWYVTGPNGSRSRIVHEHVMPLLSIGASSDLTSTNRGIVISGHVLPGHRFEQVFLQQQISSSDDWRTLRATTLNPNSGYFFAYRWRRPGIHDVRVLFRGDAKNARGASDTVTVAVEQAQVPGFTITSSSPMVASGGSVTIAGTLSHPGASSPTVQLWGKAPDQQFMELGSEPVGPNGNYSFNESDLTTNTTYFVATVPSGASPRRQTALLYQGVRDIVTMKSSSTSAGSGQAVTFTGTVSPDKTGRVIYLQKLGKDGDYHTVAAAIVQSGSTFQFNWTLGAPGTYSFRVRITSDEDNVGAVSTPPMSITATAPTPSSLPPAS